VWWLTLDHRKQRRHHGPQLPKQCRECNFFDPVAEAYACSACEVTQPEKETKVTKKEHKQRHEELHKALDELVADWLGNTKNLPSASTVMQLLQWSSKQARKPDHNLVSDAWN